MRRPLLPGLLTVTLMVCVCVCVGGGGMLRKVILAYGNRIAEAGANLTKPLQQ